MTLKLSKTPINTLLMGDDSIVTHHNLWSQEKAYLTGLEAANHMIAKLGQGQPTETLPMIPDEPHIQALLSVNCWVRQGLQGLPQFWLP